jgi:TusE/DsrC/DsvC family sulfur relay protein
MSNHPPDHPETTRDRQLRTIAGHQVYFDWEGFLWDADDWNEAIAEAMALEDWLQQLEETHWRVIRFMREYYLYHGRAPMNRHLKEGTGMSLMQLERLFPKGIKMGARRLAGLPNPKSCL